MLHLHHRQKHALDCVADEVILLWRRPNNRGEIQWVFAMRHAGDVKYRKLAFEGVTAGVVAERTFGAQFAQVNVAFQYDLRICGDFKIDRLATDEFDGIVSEKTT